MTNISRRNAMVTGVAASAVACVAACTPVTQNEAAQIDAGADIALDRLYGRFPAAIRLGQQAFGMLIMPLMTEASFGLGGAFGRGVLRINTQSTDYYSAISGTVGLQIGAQQYSHVLFFMTQDALRGFQSADRWSAGADMRYAFVDQGGAISGDVFNAQWPVVAAVFGQAGLIVGASLEGTRYTRLSL
jgi:lipid-binding SYLF domain-containing protein